MALNRSLLGRNNGHSRFQFLNLFSLKSAIVPCVVQCKTVVAALHTSNILGQRMDSSIVPHLPEEPTTPRRPLAFLYGKLHQKIQDENPHLTKHEVQRLIAQGWSRGDENQSPLDFSIRKLPQTSVLTTRKRFTPFAVFSSKNRQRIRGEYPYSSETRLLTTIKQCWADAGEEEKQFYVDYANHLNEKQDQEVAFINAHRRKLAPLLQRKPVFSFSYFLRENYDNTSTSAGGGTRRHKLVPSAAQWNCLTEDEQKKFRYLSLAERRNYYERIRNLSAEEKLCLKELAAEKRFKELKRLGKQVRRRQLRTFAKEHSRPLSIGSPYTVFAKHYFSQQTEADGKKTIFDLMNAWKVLPESEKQEYTEKYRALSTKFKRDLEAWEQKLISAGHESMVKNFHSLAWKPYLPLDCSAQAPKKDSSVLLKNMLTQRRALAEKVSTQRQQKLLLVDLQLRKVRLLEKQAAELMQYAFLSEAKAKECEDKLLQLPEGPAQVSVALTIKKPNKRVAQVSECKKLRNKQVAAIPKKTNIEGNCNAVAVIPDPKTPLVKSLSAFFGKRKASSKKPAAIITVPKTKNNKTEVKEAKKLTNKKAATDQKKVTNQKASTVYKAKKVAKQKPAGGGKIF